MFKALIPVKFEICVWSESEEEEQRERKRLGSYLKIDFRSLSSLSMGTGDLLTGLSKEMKKQFVDVGYDTLHNYHRGCSVKLTVSTCTVQWSPSTGSLLEAASSFQNVNNSPLPLFLFLRPSDVFDLSSEQ